jgi:hypothetical protein
LIVTGVIAGLVSGIVLTHLLWRDLLLLTRSDPWTIVGILVVLSTAGAVAVVWPVVRGLRIDPADVLRAL